MRILIAIIGIAMLAMVGLTATHAALENAGDDITVTNETWTPDAGNITQLNDSDRTGAFYASNVTVRDENDTLQDPGTDYDWLEENGTIRAVTGGGLDGDANATVTYEYQLTTDEQRRMAVLLSRLPTLVGYVLPVLAIVFLLRFVGGG